MERISTSCRGVVSCGSTALEWLWSPATYRRHHEWCDSVALYVCVCVCVCVQACGVCVVVCAYMMHYVLEIPLV